METKTCQRLVYKQVAKTGNNHSCYWPLSFFWYPILLLYPPPPSFRSESRIR